MIFLHSSFRVSSTWLWLRFRRSDRAIAFFEVFSEVLATIKRDQLSCMWKYDVWQSRHPSTAGYFLELLPFVKDTGGVDKFDAAMSIANFIPINGIRGDLTEAEHGYLASLITHAKTLQKIPVLSDTRTLGRLPAIKAAFPGLHVLVYRNLFHQWCSYTQLLFRGDPFFVETIRETLNASQHDPLCGRLRDLYPLGKPTVSDRNYFLCFVLLHLYLYSQVADAADLIIDVNRVASDTAHRLTVERQICELSGLSVDLSEARNTIAFSFAMIGKRDEALDEIKVLSDEIIARAPSPQGRQFAYKARAEFLEEFEKYDFYASALAAAAGPNGLLGERDSLLRERDGLRRERDNLIAECSGLRSERDGLAADRNQLTLERAALLSSTSSRLMAPVRMVRALFR